MLGPPLTDVPLPPTSSGLQGEHPPLPTPLPTSSSSSLSSSLSSSSSSSCSSSEAKEPKKTGAKKKCLYNFQDAFMETNRVVMATSAASSSVSCTATTVQSSNNPPIHLASKRPNTIGNIGSKSSRWVFTVMKLVFLIIDELSTNHTSSYLGFKPTEQSKLSHYTHKYINKL